ncbi:MAG TPA: transposase [Bacteroidales bacterium]|nr:transposase [Bacteroidales bacterium]
MIFLSYQYTFGFLCNLNVHYIFINGVLEGINSIAQLIKRKARGYRNTQYFINMIYLKIGKLDFKMPT